MAFNIDPSQPLPSAVEINRGDLPDEAWRSLLGRFALFADTEGIEVHPTYPEVAENEPSVIVYESDFQEAAWNLGYAKAIGVKAYRSLTREFVIQAEEAAADSEYVSPMPRLKFNVFDMRTTPGGASIIAIGSVRELDAASLKSYVAVIDSRLEHAGSSTDDVYAMLRRHAGPITVDIWRKVVQTALPESETPDE
ncbi:MAG: hypothetical protein WC498_00795 [Candidatus Saccharimonadales bacterium]